MFPGYFFAVRRVIKTASEQLLEQIAEILIFALFVNQLAPMGLEYACCAIVLGTTGAEIFSCLYSFLLYWGEMRKLRARLTEAVERAASKSCSPSAFRSPPAPACAPAFP